MVMTGEGEGQKSKKFKKSKLHFSCVLEHYMIHQIKPYNPLRVGTINTANYRIKPCESMAQLVWLAVGCLCWQSEIMEFDRIISRQDWIH